MGGSVGPQTRSNPYSLRLALQMPVPDQYTLLLELRRSEGAARGLAKLPHDFYGTTSSYLAEVRRTFEVELRENPSGRKGELSRQTYQRASQVARDIIEARMTKLLSLSFQASVGGTKELPNSLPGGASAVRVAHRDPSDPPRLRRPVPVDRGRSDGEPLQSRHRSVVGPSGSHPSIDPAPGRAVERPGSGPDPQGQPTARDRIGDDRAAQGGHRLPPVGGRADPRRRQDRRSDPGRIAPDRVKGRSRRRGGHRGRSAFRSVGRDLKDPKRREAEEEVLHGEAKSYGLLLPFRGAHGRLGQPLEAPRDQRLGLGTERLLPKPSRPGSGPHPGEVDEGAQVEQARMGERIGHRPVMAHRSEGSFRVVPSQRALLFAVVEDEGHAPRQVVRDLPEESFPHGTYFGDLSFL